MRSPRQFTWGSPTRRPAQRFASLAALALGTGSLVCLVCVAAPAAAQDAPSAQALRDKAKAALGTGDTAGACLLFEQSWRGRQSAGRRRPRDDVLFELADCHERIGKKAMAADASSSRSAAPGPRRPSGAPRPSAALPRRCRPRAAPAAAASPRARPRRRHAAAARPPPLRRPPSRRSPAGPAPTHLGDFMDTRLSWTFGDDDVLHATGLAYPALAQRSASAIARSTASSSTASTRASPAART